MIAVKYFRCYFLDKLPRMIILFYRKFRCAARRFQLGIEYLSHIELDIQTRERKSICALRGLNEYYFLVCAIAK